MINEIGITGQEKLKKAKVLVVGAGGLGCSVLQYLTAAGTGKIGIAEFDMVDESNLQRQVLYGSNDVGKLKSIIAKNRLEHLNSLVEFEIFNLRIGAENAVKILADFDIIVDVTDNFDARYLINDSCVILNKPMVHGSIYKFEGIVSVFNYNGGPTYRCFNPLVAGKSYKNQAGHEPGPERAIALEERERTHPRPHKHQRGREDRPESALHHGRDVRQRDLHGHLLQSP